MPVSKPIWDLGKLPFHVGPLSDPRAAGFPSHLPFRVGYDAELALVTQVFDAATLEVLRDVYARGSQLGIPMADHGLGKAYAEDFLGVVCGWISGARPRRAVGDFAKKPPAERDLSGASVLEIGCGSGHLLAALADAGAEVEGVEPDPRCKAAMERRGIPVATCEFDEFRPSRSWDAVVHYCVLEHLVDPVAFLRRQRRLLAPEGRIILAVPDCGAAFDEGDVSIFIHQHWSYFSSASLRRLAAAAGLRVERKTAARVGALLYVSLVPESDGGGAEAAGRGGEDVADDGFDPQEFVDRARAGRRRLDAYVRGVAEQGRSLGIYCPVRAINYVLEDDGPWRRARLFDDAPQLRGKYVPPFGLPVEDGAGLERQGVDDLLIMSRPFGSAIDAAVRARRPDPAPRIRHVGDVLTDG